VVADNRGGKKNLAATAISSSGNYGKKSEMTKRKAQQKSFTKDNQKNRTTKRDKSTKWGGKGEREPGLATVPEVELRIDSIENLGATKGFSMDANTSALQHKKKKPQQKRERNQQIFSVLCTRQRLYVEKGKKDGTVVFSRGITSWAKSNCLPSRKGESRSREPPGPSGPKPHTHEGKKKKRRVPFTMRIIKLRAQRKIYLWSI